MPEAVAQLVSDYTKRSLIYDIVCHKPFRVVNSVVLGIFTDFFILFLLATRTSAWAFTSTQAIEHLF